MEEPFKVVLLGDEKTGKTQIAEIGLMGKSDTETVQKTIGASFFSKKFQIYGDEYTIQLWDTAGDERYRSLVPMYMRSVNSFLLVYDVSNANSFININSFVQLINENASEQGILFLVANTINEGIPRAVSEIEGRRKAEELHAFYAEVNCRTRQGFNDLFNNVLELCISNRRTTGGDGSIPNDFDRKRPPKVKRKPSDKKNERVEVCAIQ